MQHIRLMLVTSLAVSCSPLIALVLYAMKSFSKHEREREREREREGGGTNRRKGRES